MKSVCCDADVYKLPGGQYICTTCDEPCEVSEDKPKVQLRIKDRQPTERGTAQAGRG